MSDSSRRGVLEPRVFFFFEKRRYTRRVAKSNCWPVRFADKSRHVHVADLKLLPYDDASFEPSQAPLRWEEKEAKASESSKRGLSVAASTNECIYMFNHFKAGMLGPAFAS